MHARVQCLIKYSLALVGLAAASLAMKQLSFLVFHTVAELFSIIIAATVFTIAIKTRRLAANPFFGLLGISLGAVGLLDFMHTLAYKGMNLLPVAGANAATQLWIAGRYLLALSLLLALVQPPAGRRLGFRNTAIAYATATALAAAAIFAGWFPACYVEGSGLTPFKIASEYLVMGLFAAGIAVLWLRRGRLETRDRVFVTLGLASLMLTEFLFTLYIGVYDLSNFTGHLFKIISYYFLYKALVESSLTRPMNSLLSEADARIAELTELNRRIAAMQDQLVRSEKLGFLGKLAASLTHEINTPLGTISSGARSADQLLGELFPGLLDRIRAMDAGTFAWFRGLAARALEPIADEAALAAPPVNLHRERRRQAEELRGLGLDASDDFADCLQELGIGTAEVRQDLARFTAPDAAALLRLARALRHFRRNNRINGLAVEKANRAIQSLKRYSAGAWAGARGEIDLGALVETALGLHQPEMRDSVRTVRRFAPVPPVLGNADQISLVIGNLLENSLQAMDWCGTVTVALEERGGGALLTVADDGPGIAPELQERVFQPFFSTKAPGEGIGIGLDLCSKIIAEHAGTIDFTSRPGDTAFRVWLPGAPTPRSVP